MFTDHTKRWRRRFLFALVLAAPVGLAVASELSPPPSEGARVWYAGLSETEKVTASLNITSLEPFRQKVVFANLSAEAKSAFWRKRLLAFAEGLPPEKAEARAAVNAAMDFLSADYFRDPSKLVNESRAIRYSVAQHFDQATFNAVMKFGIPSKPSFGSDPIGWFRTRIVAQASSLPCDCALEQEASELCSGFKDLYCHAGDACTPVDEACYLGWGQWGTCYGQCRHKLPGGS